MYGTKHSKRYLSAVLTIILIFTMIAPAFAQDEEDYDDGVIRGDGDSSYMEKDDGITVAEAVYEGDDKFLDDIVGAESGCAQEETEQGLISGGDVWLKELPAHVMLQSVEYGTALEELNLPDKLSGVIEDAEADVSVTWECDSDYAGDKGIYIFTPVLAEGYDVINEPPDIVVVVRAQEKIKSGMSLMSLGGGAIEDDPFMIGSPRQLKAIADMANEGLLEWTFLGSNYTPDKQVYLKLDNDIDLSAYGRDYDEGKGWYPIGDHSGEYVKYSFQGVFDGGGHKITGLYIDRPQDDYVGLFGYIEYYGSVKNLGIENASIIGKNSVGGLVGELLSNYNSNLAITDFPVIENCYVKGSVKGKINVGGLAGKVQSGSSDPFKPQILSSFSEGKVTGDYNLGGITGYMNADISDCYSRVSIISQGSQSMTGYGGIAGTIGKPGLTIKNTYSTGSLEGYNNVGGIIGSTHSLDISISSSAALNPVLKTTYTDPSYTYIGRIKPSKDSNTTLSNNIAYNGMKVLKNNADKVLDEGQDKADGESKSAAEIKSTDFFKDLFKEENSGEGGDSGDESPWIFADGELPILAGIPANAQNSAMPSHIKDPDDPYFMGQGTEGDSYQIETAEQMARLAELVNNSDSAIRDFYQGKSYELTEDIDISDIDPKGDGSGWIPIGGVTTPFLGVFDGKGHTVSGLYINRSENYQGLFGNVSNGIIRNLGVINVEMTISENDSSFGGITGILFGNGSSGLVENCYTSGKIKGLDGNSTDFGGIAGYVSGGIIKNCYSSMDIESKAMRVGGIVGQLFANGNPDSKVENCYSSGNIQGSDNAGGIAGYLNANIINCVALNPSVSASAYGSSYVGRVAGQNNDGNNISNCVAFGGMTVTADGQPKEITETASETDIDGASKTGEEIAAEGFFQGLFDNENQAWVFENGKLPILAGFGPMVQDTYLPGHISGKYFKGEGSSENPYKIETAKQLAKLAELVNSDDVSENRSKYNTESIFYVMTADIDLSGYGKDYDNDKGWKPIGNTTSRQFNANFDGDSHTITDLYINRPDENIQGLFGTAHYASIKNVGIINGDITGNVYVGGIVGAAAQSGELKPTKIAIENCFFGGSIKGAKNVGGIAGLINGEEENGFVKYCYSEVNVESTCTDNDADKDSGAGGIAGWLENGTIQNCYSNSIVKCESKVGVAGGIVGTASGIIQNCYSNSVVNSKGEIGAAGGIAGLTMEGEVQNCYTAGEATGDKCSGGVIGMLLQGAIRNSVALQVEVSVSDGEGSSGRIVGIMDDVSLLEPIYKEMLGEEEFDELFPDGLFAGLGDSLLSCNYAYYGMTGCGDNKTLDGEDGADIFSSLILEGESFWADSGNWDTGAPPEGSGLDPWNTDNWDFKEGKLPLLKDTHGSLISGQNGSPDMYLIQFPSASSLTVELSGEGVTAASGKSYDVPANYEESEIKVCVRGNEIWTNPGLTIKANKGTESDLGDEISVTQGPVNGKASFEVPANYSGNIVVRAISTGNPNVGQTAVLRINKKSLKPADFSDIQIPTGRIYNGEPQGIDEITIPGNPDAKAAVKYNGSDEAPVNAGTYTVTIHYDGDEVYYATDIGGISIGDYTIAKKPITIIPKSGQGKIYGEPDPALEYEESVGLIGGDTITGGSLSRIDENGNINSNEWVRIKNFITIGTLTAGPNYELSVPEGADAVQFTIREAKVTGIVTEFKDVTKTAYEVRDPKNIEDFIRMCGLPEEAEVTIEAGSATIYINWDSEGIDNYNPLGGIYRAVGTLNDPYGNIDPQDQTIELTIAITPITAGKPIFADTTVTRGGNNKLKAKDIEGNILPLGGTIIIDEEGIGEEDSKVGYTIAWDGGEVLDGTAVGNSQIFTGTITYSNAPNWLTLPDDTMVQRKITIISPPSGDRDKDDRDDRPQPTPPATPTVPAAPAEPGNLETADKKNENPKSTVIVTTNVKTETKEADKATAVVEENQLKEAIAKAKEAVKAQEETVKPQIKIDLGETKEANSIETTIPAGSFAEMVNGHIDSLIISSDMGELAFDNDSLKTIMKEAKEEIKIEIAKVDMMSLPEEVKEKVKDRPVYDFNVKSGEEKISKLGGNVKVTLPYTLAAGEDPNAIVVYFINDDGELVIIINGRYNKETGTVIFETDHFSKYYIGYNKIEYKDVKETDWYKDAVTFIIARGISTGTSENTFSPDGKLTRGQLITLLMRVYDIKPIENYKDNFKDAGDIYYTGYLAAAKKMNLTKGIGDNKFAPDNSITRQDMMTLLYNTLRAMGKLPANKPAEGTDNFNDHKDIAEYAKAALEYMVKAGIITGSNGNFLPKDTTTRAQLAQVLYNLVNR